MFFLHSKGHTVIYPLQKYARNINEEWKFTVQFKWYWQLIANIHTSMQYNGLDQKSKEHILFVDTSNDTGSYQHVNREKLIKSFNKRSNQIKNFIKGHRTTSGAGQYNACFLSSFGGPILGPCQV